MNTVKFTFHKTGLTGLQFGTCVNVTSGEFRGSSSNTNFLSNKKVLIIFKTCRWLILHEIS